MIPVVVEGNNPIQLTPKVFKECSDFQPPKKVSRF